MKFAYLMGKAPADFAGMASKLYPIVVKAPIVGMFGLTANQFILILAVLEMVACLGFFFNHRVASVLVLAVMAGAEFIAFTQRANSAMPANPMCGDKASCVGSHVFHAVLALFAVLAHQAAKPLCSQCCIAWNICCKGRGCTAAEVTTPSRPRRAAAMKKKDQ